MPKIVEKTATVRSRIEPKLKADFKKTLAQLGLSESEAITVFVRQVVMRQGMPFDVKIPNAVTRAAMDEDESTEQHHKSVSQMRADILNEQE